MNSKDQKQPHNSRKDQADGQGEGTRDPFEAARPQPSNTPSQREQPSPDAEEERSDLADVGEADEQEGTVEGMKKGAAHQDPPATLPQERRHERRHNM
jgi:hypothetical protein